MGETAVVLPVREFVLLVSHGPDFLGIAKRFNTKNVNLPRGRTLAVVGVSPVEDASKILFEQTRIRALDMRLLDTFALPAEDSGLPSRTLYACRVIKFEGRLSSTNEGRVFWYPLASFLAEGAEDRALAETLFRKLHRITP